MCDVKGVAHYDKLKKNDQILQFLAEQFSVFKIVVLGFMWSIHPPGAQKHDSKWMPRGCVSSQLSEHNNLMVILCQCCIYSFLKRWFLGTV